MFVNQQTVRQIKCKILILTYEFPPGPGGIGNQSFNLAKFLLKNHLPVKIITNLENTSRYAAKEFDEKYQFDCIRISRYWLLPLTYFKRIYYAFRILKRFKPEVCFCSGKFSLWTGSWLKKFFSKTDFIAIAHGTEINLKGSISSKLTSSSLRRFDKIVSVSKYTNSLLPKQPEFQKRFIIPNGIDIEEFKMNKSLNTKNLIGDPIFLTVGNVTKRKGQHNFIKVIPELLKQFPDLHYYCVGLATHQAEFESLANDLDIGDRITFTGKVSYRELLHFYESCTVFVMLSEIQADGDVEGFGIAILEANIFGKPAIGSNDSGIRDAIEHEKTGFLVDNQNVSQISNAVKKILGNYQSFGDEAVKWAKMHDWEVICKEYMKIIESEI